MKQVVKVSVVAGLMALGIQSQAEALPNLRVIGCQGTLCVSTPFTGPGSAVTANFGPVTIGDYLIDSGDGSASQTSAESFVSSTTIDVQRIGESSTDALVVWVEATGFDEPSGSPLTMNTIHNGNAIGISNPSVPATITYQAWLSDANLGTGYVGSVAPTPPAVAGTAPSIPAGSASNGPLACNIPAGTPQGCGALIGSAINVPATPPFSLVTRTIIAIGLGDDRRYTSGSQVSVTGQAVVPEPASMMLLGSGLMGLAAAARRRRRANAN